MGGRTQLGGARRSPANVGHTGRGFDYYSFFVQLHALHNILFDEVKSREEGVSLCCVGCPAWMKDFHCSFVWIIEDTNFTAVHPKSLTIRLKDIVLARRLRGTGFSPVPRLAVTCNVALPDLFDLVAFPASRLGGSDIVWK